MKRNKQRERLWVGGLCAVLFLTSSTVALAANSAHQQDNAHGFMVFVMTCLAIIAVGTTLHVKERLNIFIDYTDAVVTAGSLLMPLVLYVVLSYFLPEGFAKFMMRAAFVVGIAVVVRSSWIHNPTPGMAAISVLTKYATALLFAATMALLALGQQNVTRRGGESDVSYELRKMQASAANARLAVMQVLVAAFFGWFCAKVSRRSEYGPVGPYFATDFTRLPPHLLFSSSGSFSGQESAASESDEASESAEEDAHQEGTQQRESRPPREPLVILGLDEDASEEEIEERYRELLKKYHPDKVSHLGQEFAKVAHEKMIEIQKAYEELHTH